MKYSVSFLRIAMFFLLGFGVISVDNVAYAEEDAIIIKIGIEENDPDAGFTLTPDEITIEKGTIVIWVNFIDGPEINVEFNDPSATVAASKDHKGFYLDNHGVFSAKHMPYIATSSLRFITCGKFLFTIKSQDGTKTKTGKIIVK